MTADVCAADHPHRDLTEKVIGAALEVHRVLGPGLLESVYLEALRAELLDRGLESAVQVAVPVKYKGRQLASDLRLDLLVAGRLIVEVKSVASLADVHGAQLLSYLRLTGLPVGLLINFNVSLLKSGLRRVVNSHSSATSASSAPLR
jgi:GxxExxY protein